MVKLAVFCVALAGGPAGAGELMAQWGWDAIRLEDAPCTQQAVLQRLDPQDRPRYRAASALMAGRVYVACWRMDTVEARVLYEDGDEGVIPLADIKPLLST